MVIFHSYVSLPKGTTINHLNVPGCHSTLRLFAATSSQAPFSAHWEPAPWKRNCWLSPYPHTFRLRNASGAKTPEPSCSGHSGIPCLFWHLIPPTEAGKHFWIDRRTAARPSVWIFGGRLVQDQNQDQLTSLSWSSSLVQGPLWLLVGGCWWLRLSLCAKGRSQPSAKFQSFHGDPGDYDVRALSRKGCCEALVERQRPFLCVVWLWYPWGFLSGPYCNWYSFWMSFISYILESKKLSPKKCNR